MGVSENKDKYIKFNKYSTSDIEKVFIAINRYMLSWNSWNSSGSHEIFDDQLSRGHLEEGTKWF